MISLAITTIGPGYPSIRHTYGFISDMYSVAHELDDKILPPYSTTIVLLLSSLLCSACQLLDG
jgi:hypothetical protein